MTFVNIKKNGQTASSRTRKIMNRGFGIYKVIAETPSQIQVQCQATRWQGWLPRREIIITQAKAPIRPLVAE